MNLYLRLFKVIVAGLFGQRIETLGESAITLRVWPNDLDFNLHMNNGRYLTLMDLGRLDLVVRAGLLGIAFRKGWMPVLASATIRFRRSLAPFQRFRLRTRVLGWDARNVIMEQVFETLDGQVAARALVRGVFRRKGGTVPTADIAEAAGWPQQSPELPERVTTWLTSEDRLSERSLSKAA